MENPVVLQSGFVIVPNSNFIIDPNTNEEVYTTRDLKYNNHIIRMQSSFAYHGGLNDLWERYLNNGLILHSFEIQEQLYRLTYDCFNNFSFKEFILLQTNSSSIMKYQKRFINDLYLIMNSEQPKMSLAAWAEIVYALPQENGNDMLEPINTNTPVSTVSEFIMSLLSSHNGPETLMMVMGIIFGNKRIPILA